MSLSSVLAFIFIIFGEQCDLGFLPLGSMYKKSYNFFRVLSDVDANTLKLKLEGSSSTSIIFNFQIQ